MGPFGVWLNPTFYGDDVFICFPSGASRRKPPKNNQVFLVPAKENWTKRKLLGPRNQKKIAPETKRKLPAPGSESCLFCYGTQEMTEFRAPELRNPQIPCSRVPNPSNLALRPSRNLCLPTKAYRGLPSAPGFLIEKCPLPIENSQ